MHKLCSPKEEKFASRIRRGILLNMLQHKGYLLLMKFEGKFSLKGISWASSNEMWGATLVLSLDRIASENARAWWQGQWELILRAESLLSLIPSHLQPP